MNETRGPTRFLIGTEPTRFGIGGRRLSPFVGREVELQFLLERLERVREGTGQVVWITGEPGVGKSRLLFEFRQRLDDLAVACLEGRCVSHGVDIPYSLLHDILQRAWALPDAPDAVLPVVRDQLKALGLGHPHSPAILTRWLGGQAEIPAGVTPEKLRLQGFDLLQQILVASARLSPCVLLLEDLHWADPGSTEFLTALVDHIAASRLLVVLSARSGHELRSVDRSFVSRLALPPLSRADGATLARVGLPPTTTADVVTRIVDRASGNPFFLEELVWAAEGGLGTVPGTVTAALMARMDRLARGPRGVLEAAAVIGREVPMSLLEAIVPDAHDIPQALEALVRVELLNVQPGSTYVFKHALTQEVAYSRLTLEKRQQLHRAAGEIFETAAPHRLEELAYHWDRTDDHRQAIAYATRFAEQAIVRYALTESVSVLHRALIHCDALPAGRERDRLTVVTATQLALPLTLLGRTAEIKDALLPRLDMVERLADPALSAPFFFSLTLAADHTADRDAAETFGARAIDEARRAGDRVTEGRALVMLSFSSMWASRLHEGVERARRALECLDMPVEAFWRGHALLTESQLLLMLGDLDGAQRAAEELKTVGETVADNRLHAYGLIYSAMVIMARGAVAEALKVAKRALETANDPLARATISGYLGEIAARAGELPLARDTLTAALDFVRRAHFRQLEAWDLMRLAEAELTAGADLARADAIASEAAVLAKSLGFRYVQGRAEHVRGEVALHSGGSDDGVAFLASAVSIFERIEAPHEWQRATRCLAEAFAAKGGVEQAASLRTAVLEGAKRACHESS